MRRWRQLGEILKLVLMSQLLMGLDLPFTQCVLDATGKLVTPGVGSVVNKGRQLPKKIRLKRQLQNSRGRPIQEEPIEG
jgi:hypothetical protein